MYGHSPRSIAPAGATGYAAKFLHEKGKTSWPRRWEGFAFDATAPFGETGRNPLVGGKNHGDRDVPSLSFDGQSRDDFRKCTPEGERETEVPCPRSLEGGETTTRRSVGKLAAVVGVSPQAGRKLRETP
jgi:hypothetical protein